MGFRDCVIHTAEEIERIRVAAAKTAEVRDQLAELVRPGMTTLQIDILAGELIHATGGTSAFLNYHGYPGNICISVNDEVVHGIGVADRTMDAIRASMEMQLTRDEGTAETNKYLGIGKFKK